LNSLSTNQPRPIYVQIGGDGISDSAPRAIARQAGGTVLTSEDYPFEWSFAVQFDLLPEQVDGVLDDLRTQLRPHRAKVRQLQEHPILARLHRTRTLRQRLHDQARQDLEDQERMLRGVNAEIETLEQSLQEERT